MNKIYIDDVPYEGNPILDNNNGIIILEFKKTKHGIGEDIGGITFINEIKKYFPELDENIIDMVNNEYFFCKDGKIEAYLL